MITFKLSSDISKKRARDFFRHGMILVRKLQHFCHYSLYTNSVFTWSDRLV